jgi:hypothetical protein
MKKILLALSLISCSAFADLSVKDFHNKGQSKSTNTYLKGLVDGLNIANATMESEKTPPLFCYPPFLKLSMHDYKKIIDLGIEEADVKSISQINVDSILLNKLIELYPCGFN